MRGNNGRRVITVALPFVFLLAVSGTVLGQFDGCYTPWATKKVLSYTSNGQVGLAAINGYLILTWADQTSSEVYSSASTDGVNWSTQQYVGLPNAYSSMYGAPPPYANGGVTMTTSTSCGYAYVAFADSTGQNIYGARTTGPQNGTTVWDGPYKIWTLSPTISAQGLQGDYYQPPPAPSDFSTSAPALYANDPNVIRFAFPQYTGNGTVWQPGRQDDSGGANTYGYTVQVGQFNCDFSHPQLANPNCFFTDGTTCLDSTNSIMNIEYDEGWVDYAKVEVGYNGASWVPSGPWSPLWTGAVLGSGQVLELKAIAQGNSLGNLNPPLWWSTYNETTQAYSQNCVGNYCAPPSGGYGIYKNPPPYPPALAGNWANNGIGGAVNPADGTAYLAFSCRQFNGDTCQNTPYIQLYRASSNSYCTEDPAKFGSGEWSLFAPAMTFFNGKMWLAWRGALESGNGYINVASIDPSQIVWTGQPCVNGQYCTSNSQCCSGLCQGGLASPASRLGGPAPLTHSAARGTA